MPPRGWIETTIAQVASVRGDKAHPSTLDIKTPYIGLEHIEPHSSRLLGLGKVGDVRSTVAQFKKGDILFSRLRPYLNKVTQAMFDGCASAEIVPFAPNDGIEPSLLKRVMMSQDFLAFTASLDKGDRPRVSASEVEEYRFFLPPNAEQRRIVAKLDALTARIACARAELDRVPLLTKRLRDVALTAAFEGILVEEPGIARAAWRSVPFNETAEIASNLVDPREIAHLPHIAPNHIISGLPRLLPYKTIAEDEVVSSKHHFHPGQIIYSKIRPYLRKVVLVDFEGGCSADMYPINARCNPRYLMYWMLSPQFTWLASRQEGRTVLPKINQNGLNAITTPLAPDDIQQIIAEKLDNIFARASRLEAEVARARALLDRLEASILAKAFRGELVPQDPNDEPASALLERIRAQRAAAAKPKRGRRVTVESEK